MTAKTRQGAKTGRKVKPFAFLKPGSVFDSERRLELMRRHGVQLLIPNQRIHFETPHDAARAG